MCRFCYLFFALLLSCSSAFCQRNNPPSNPGISKPLIDSVRQRTDSIARLDKPRMMFSFSVGPDICTFYREKYLDSQVPFFRYAAGIGFMYSLRKRFAVGSSLLYEAKGDQSDYAPLKYSTDPAGDTRHVMGSRLDYVTLTLNAQYFFDSRHRFYGGLGMSVGVLAKEQVYSYFYDTNGDFIYQYMNASDYLDRFEAGLIATIGYRHRLGKTLFLSSQLIGNLGITSIEPDVPEYNAHPMSNANLILLIGIGIAHN